MVREGHLKEFIDEEKSRAEKAEVQSSSKFDRSDDDEQAKAVDEDEYLPLGTIHMIRGSNYPDIENKIRGEIRMIKQMYEVFSFQSLAKKLRKTATEPRSITFTKANLKRVQHLHSDPWLSSSK